MVIRLHFTASDIARVRLAPGPAPLQEVAGAVRKLGNQRPAHAAWRREVLAGVDPGQLHRLVDLVCGPGCRPEFVVPLTEGVDEGIEQIMAQPAAVVRQDLAEVNEYSGVLPRWTEELVPAGSPRRREVGAALRAVFAAAVVPYWPTLLIDLQADRARLVSRLVLGGVDALLSDLHPAVRWDAPVLQVGLGNEPAHDIFLEGRGLVLIPSLFLTGRPAVSTGDDPSRTPALSYPVLPELPVLSAPAGVSGSDAAALARLLGATRAAVLTAVAAEPGQSTSAVAANLEIAVASASEHLAVLRGAGLVASRRRGTAMAHRATDLGGAVLRAPRAGF
ncbi:winged helix-turn-helix domain-containing protein [Nakamurella aerolata]|uniref:Helix-turn-helix transcriptional regulator n=1 Tax=Nakamurella aerolata TaxID=1656892 RepID=A0A849A163_9ACTN|nr:helix-turn-helix domain-containing protein [Nakamurella aerolata]NNG34379.1 helix-turn-helix transcriptional regulator [Nakamurella aerolata]